MRSSPTFPARPMARSKRRRFGATLHERDHDDPTTISLRVYPSRRQLEVVKAICASRVAACIPQHWRALPARAKPDLLPIARQNDHARLAWRKPK